MRRIKNIALLVFLVYSVSIQYSNVFAQTGNISINFKNTDGTSTPLPGANGRVLLYNANYDYLSAQSTNSLGIAIFTNYSYGTYYFEGYHNPNPATIFGSEYWGSSSVNHNSSETVLNLTRSVPCYSSYKVFINSSNVEVTGLTVSSGIPLRIEVNIANSASSSKTVKGRLVLDRDKTSGYDYDQTSAGSTVSGNGVVKFTFLYTPTGSGSYCGAMGVLTSVNSNYIITDGTGWSANPLFTLVPLPPVLSSPLNSAVDVSTSPVLSWAASVGATSYQVQVSTSSLFSSTVYSQSGITGTSVTVNPPLSDGTTYYWRVNASNSGGTSNWQVRSFTTIINETRITTIDFAGLKWNVSEGLSGPGPNNWLNSINTIWVDNSGNLHLKIRKIGEKWYCSAIAAQDTMGYGEYSFSVVSDVEIYDPNIVVGLFNYENDSKEIDIEFSRWGTAGSDAGGYVVQPASASSSYSFPLNLQGSSSVHKFTWTKTDVKFQSYHSSGNLIKEWIYRGSNNPLPNRLKPHINFWLKSGLAPKNLNEAELVISNFKFTPINLLTRNSADEGMSTEYRLVQNYPNPFNPATRIKYNLPESSYAQLKIYDSLGRDVDVLINQKQSAGFHEVEFNAGNLPSGIYYYRLSTPKFTSTKKFILMK